MAKTIDKSNLGYLGLDFQYKLAKFFIEEPTFFNEVNAIVDQNSFTDPLLRTFVGTLKDYYNKEGVTPSYDVIKIALRQRSTSEIELAEWDEFITKLKVSSFEGYSLVKENALKFFKQQRIIKAANKILEKAGSGDIDQYEECENILKEALYVGDDDDLGHSIYDLMDKAVASDYTVSIPTGINGLDEALGGGLDKGKVGLFMAALGVGKTTYSTAISSAAATCQNAFNNNEGFKVLQIYFEDDDVDITRKHMSRLTNVEAFEFKRLESQKKDEIVDILSRHPKRDLIEKNLRLLRMRTGDTSASDIEKKILKLTNKGFKPDLVVIDYFECLDGEKGGPSNESEWNREGRTMRKIENIAKDHNIAIWVTTQGGRDSITSEYLTSDKGSGSIKKQQIVQVIVGAARSLEAQDTNTANITLNKNRSGRSGKAFTNIYYDNGTSTIDCSKENVVDDLEEFKRENKRLMDLRKAEMLKIVDVERYKNELQENLKVIEIKS